MSVRFLFNITCCALLSCTISGCYSYNQYPYGGTYPGPYGSPSPYEMGPGAVAPGSIPPGNYPVQPDLGQPVPPPQGSSLPPSGSQNNGGAFPSNTNYDGVDSQWKQPINSTPSAGTNSPTPFGANPTASGNNTNPSRGLNGNQEVPVYDDPNENLGNSLTPDNEFPSNKNNSFPNNVDNQFESNQNPQPTGTDSTQMKDQFGPSENDQFEQNDNSGFSVPEPVQQQSFESSSDTFNENPAKFEANPSDSFNSTPSDSFDANPTDSFEVNPKNSSPNFEAPINSFPENNDDATFGPNSSSMMNPSSRKVGHANHQTTASGPQLVKSDPFMTPAKFQSASFELPTKNSRLQTSAAKSPSPFNYDKQQYRWLRGVVEFDKQEKSWNITYNATPDRTDKFGGNIVLVDDQGKLNRFTNGDVVLLDGHIDGSQQDKMGKPRYRISKAQRLLPKK